MSKKNILLIIGNGFDLELGLKTNYKDFIESDIYERYLSKFNGGKQHYDITRDANIPIFRHFKERLSIQKWIDLEIEIGRLSRRMFKNKNPFSSNNNEGEVIPIDSTDFMKKSFEMLRKCLNEYLLSLTMENTSDNNYAVQLADILIRNRCDDIQVVTFNYTPLEKVLGKEINVPVHYIHGKVTGGSNVKLILGVQDELEIHKSYSYVIKSHSPYYKSSHIIDKLENADEVIFFGHSLGETDYPYFSDFFQSQCKRIAPNERKKIRIFTYDEESRLEILYQLRVMNNKQTRMFYENSNFAIYRTKDEIDDIYIQLYFAELIGNLCRM